MLKVVRSLILIVLNTPFLLKVMPFLYITLSLHMKSSYRNALDIQTTISWWHGKGGLLDYSNPEAVDWWHKQMDQVIVYG